MLLPLFAISLFFLAAILIACLIRMDMSLSGHRSRRGHYVIFVCEFLAQRGQEEAGRLIVAREAKADAFERAAEVVAPLPAADEPIVVKRQRATTSL